MGIALLTASSLFMPLQSIAAWFVKPSSSARSPVTPHLPVKPREKAPQVALPQTKCLRVIHAMDGQQRRPARGRVVISGRMSDVCAELDRLAALEAREVHLQRLH